MTNRRQKGLLIAATSHIIRKGRYWLVPSQTGRKVRYRVQLTPHPSCSCLDHQTTGKVCKHVHAVRYQQRRRKSKRPLKRVPTVKQALKRPTYPQVWPAYNAAQMSEKELFLRLLHELCQRIPEPPRGSHRPRAKLTDMVFACCFKIYSRMSGRRFHSDLRQACEAGQISKVPHFNTIFNCLSREDLGPHLHDLIVTSSAVLGSVEVDFAVDSSGFTSTRFISWIHHKYGNLQRHHDWVKVHLMCGVKTHVVTAVEIHDKEASDNRRLPSLVELTAKHFQIREVSADKVYGTVENYDAITRAGGTPYIAFKEVHTGYSGGLWKEMFTMFKRQRSEFLSHYHKRSNVESTFSMIKAKFGDHVWSRGETAMKNEVLCKIVCHNICRLIHAMHELKIHPEFSQRDLSSKTTQSA